ncbi:hypothetical protein HL657_07790 [Methanoculleus sp. YWC-01]|jgi:hypothetical protein|uniref:Uncharacterized protein n=1 Tax=Methanoculleus nereidis TaxID=2735141 RepID=A0ABU3Z2N4_9EURY|nr:hypothetical protein [Methanoculleus sp. YWC-01]MCK9299429.1 hypothetical protein [Methanoculleus sp.]MDV4343072.1 hypothetical protein [Methanoculleus sp. YWC-01]PKL55242.1 MAG: hypothetical protein CVV35_11085 [Methanomicrobiales archaeon HGW-Methanomicrobiales-6]
MKDVFDVFNEGFEEITRMVEQGNYKGPFVYSSNLTLFSTLLDYEDGILVSEILEGVFSQVGPFAEELGAEEIRSINEQLAAQMKIITDSYRTEDKNALYQALRDLRSIATKFQIKCMRSRPMKVQRQTRLNIGDKYY